ncbi:MAG TPA: DUF2752 domain-containing protein [Acidimicrobiales bacterium]|jgi:hypothetical protein
MSPAVDRRSTDDSGPAADVIGWSAVGIGAVGIVAVGSQRMLGLGPHACAARALLGVPCPVCGLSTSAAELAHGQLGRAIAADGLGVAFILTVAVLAGVHLARTIGVGRAAPLPTVAGLVAAGLLAAHWAATVTGLVTLTPLP